MRMPILLASALASTLLCAEPASAAWKTTVYSPPGSPGFTWLWGVNASGMIVGQDDFGGLLLDHGVATAVNPPGTLAALTGISNSGLIVGSYFDGTGTVQTSFLDQSGTFTSFALPGESNTSIRSISANGRYLAGTYTDGVSVLQGFVFDRDTATATTIPLAAGQSINVVQGVNDAGDVTGSYAGAGSFIFSLSTHTELAVTSAAGLTDIRLRAINDAGQVAGWATSATGTLVGILGTPTGGFDTFEVDPGGQTVLYGLNDDGEAVGFVVDAAGNNQGLIVQAVGTVPEPLPAALLAAGSALLAALRRRRVR